MNKYISPCSALIPLQATGFSMRSDDTSDRSNMSRWHSRSVATAACWASCRQHDPEVVFGVRDSLGWQQWINVCSIRGVIGLCANDHSSSANGGLWLEVAQREGNLCSNTDQEWQADGLELLPVSF